MNKEFAASLLTLSATLTTQLLVPQSTYAASNRHFISTVKHQDEKVPFYTKLQSKESYRYIDNKGQSQIGKIIIHLQHGPVISESLESEGEIAGWIAFETETEYFGLIGEDGAMLLDFIGNFNSEKTYSLYSCSSSLNICEKERLFISFKNGGITLKGQMPTTERLFNLEGTQEISTEFENSK